MKRLLVGALVLILLFALPGCQKTEPVDPAPGQTAPQTEIAEPVPEPMPEVEPISEPEPFAFTRDNLPRLDGSTATVPLAEAVCATLLGESREDVKDLVHFSKTTQAYYNLMSGDADLLIVYEANADVYEEKERRGFEWQEPHYAVEGAERFEDELLGGGAPGLLRAWENGAQHYYREDGTPLPELTVTNSYDDTVSVKGGLVETLELNYATYYDLDTMDVVFRAYLGYEGD